MAFFRLFSLIVALLICSCASKKNALPPPSGDEDGDGINNGDEGSDDPGGPIDTDGDGTPDYLDPDSDGDSLPDEDEGVSDSDGDSTPDVRDPRNDGPAQAITLKEISTNFNNPIGIDHHDPTNSVIVSVNYATGATRNFERITNDGMHHAFSTVSGLTEEVKIAMARTGNPAGFAVGTLFVGNGLEGQIARISPDGSTIDNPWVNVDPAPGTNNGLMRGSLYVDRTGLYNGDLIAVTTTGQVWRVNAAGQPTLVKSVVGAPHLEGVIVVPDAPARYGPLAGKIIAGAEAQTLLYAFDAAGNVQTHNVGVRIEDIDLVPIQENFFGVAFGVSKLYGAAAADFVWARGDILLTEEYGLPTPGTSTARLYRLVWDLTTLTAQPIPLTVASVTTIQWEHVTFSPAGIVEVPPVE